MGVTVDSVELNSELDNVVRMAGGRAARMAELGPP